MPNNEISRRQFLNILFPEVSLVKNLVQKGAGKVLTDPNALPDSTKIGLGLRVLETSLFSTAGCASSAGNGQSESPKITEYHTTQDILQNIQNKTTNLADTQAYGVVAFGSTLALSQTEFLALNLGEKVLPILETGKVIGLAIPTTAIVTSLLLNPMLPADVIEPIRLPIFNESGKIIKYQEMTPQQAFFIRTGKVVRVVELQDLSQINQAIEGNFALAQSDSDADALANYENEIERIMNWVPDGWKPPDKDYCGQKMDQYYALLLMDETIAILMIDQWNITHNNISLNPKIGTEYDNKYRPIRDKIEQQLKDKDCYLYHKYQYPEGSGNKSGGSVYSDYKHMRAIGFPKLGKLSQWQKSTFNLNQSADKMYNLCLKEVQTWWNLPLPK